MSKYLNNDFIIKVCFLLFSIISKKLPPVNTFSLTPPVNHAILRVILQIKITQTRGLEVMMIADYHNNQMVGEALGVGVVCR